MCKRLICVTLFVLGLAAASAQATLVHHWRLDDTGTTAVDSAGGLNGVVQGGPVSVPGKVGNALQFDGANDVVTISNFATPPKATVAFWINSPLTMTTAMQRVFGTGGNYEIWINSAGDIAHELFDNGSYGVMAMGALKANEWTHLAFTYDKDTTMLEIYVNGALNVGKNAQTPSTPTATTLLIGHRSGGAADQRFAGMLDDVQIYDEVLGAKQIKALCGSEAANNPSPGDGDKDVPREVVLSWGTGEFAQTHDVYLGEAFDDVNDASRSNPLNVLVNRGQDANNYDPLVDLGFGKTWYWRVDEVNAPPSTTIFKGDVWSFKTELIADPIKNVIATSNGVSEADQGPQNTVNGSGMDPNDRHSTLKTDMWLATAPGEPLHIQFEFDRVYKIHEMFVWNHNGEYEKFFGFGLKNVDITYSTDGASWTALGSATLEQATASATYDACTVVPLGGVAAKYVRLNVVSAYGTSDSYGLSEVRFTYVPTYARQPEPDTGDTGVGVDSVLRWRAGRDAVTHDVYLSKDQQAVVDGTAPVQTVTENRVAPGGLEYGQVYYWKVNEVGTDRTWKGDVWSFTTPQGKSVDNMESYTGELYKEIWATWLDGTEFGTNDPTNGSIVGLDPTAGNYGAAPGRGTSKYSLPIWFNNATASKSEVTRTFAPAPDWTAHGIKGLSLWFYGALGNSGRLYVKINNGAPIYYPGDAATIGRPWWTPWVIDLTATGANLKSVSKLTIGVDGAGATGVIYVDDIEISASVVEAEQIWIEAEAATTITAPLEAADRADASAGRYIGSVDAGLSRSSGPGTDGTGLATYKFTVRGGVYTVRVREIIATGQADSWWVRIQGATLNVKTHASGWTQWNGVPVSQNWAWNTIYSSDDGGKTVLFTLPAGTYTLEMAYREDGCLLDALVIVAQ